MAPDPSPDPLLPVLVGGGVATVVAEAVGDGLFLAEAVGDGLLVATASTAAATCQVPPNAAIPSPLVCPAAESPAK